MTRKKFISETAKFILLAAKLNEKARKHGISSLEDELEDLDDEDFKYALRRVVDGVAPAPIGEILSNRIAFEKDKYMRRYKTILKRAALGIQEGLNSHTLFHVLLSYAGLTPNEEKEIEREFPKRDFVFEFDENADSSSNEIIMNRTQFNEQYSAFIKKALQLAEKARREGILSLTADPEKISERNIFEYGLNFAIDGTDPFLIEKILNYIIAQETDEYTRVFKTMQKEAVIGIQQGLNPQMLYYILNSLSDISLKNDEAYKSMNADKAKVRNEAHDKEIAAMLKALDEEMGIKPKEETDTKQQLTFDDIIRFDDRCVQYILRNVDSHDLTVALKSASQAVQGKIFKNMSRNAAVTLKEDMDYMGTLREEDAQKAAQETRQKIIDIILLLAERGEIIIGAR
jgi:flagellar motor component MotA